MLNLSIKTILQYHLPIDLITDYLVGHLDLSINICGFQTYK